MGCSVYHFIILSSPIQSYVWNLHCHWHILPCQRNLSETFSRASLGVTSLLLLLPNSISYRGSHVYARSIFPRICERCSFARAPLTTFSFVVVLICNPCIRSNIHSLLCYLHTSCPWSIHSLLDAKKIRLQYYLLD